MIERAQGLVLRARPFTETSLIVQWLTSELGRISTVAKGARRATSPFRGKLDLFYLADFSFQRSRSSELHTLREVVLRDPHPVLRQDLGYLNQAAYAAALIEQTTESETPLPAVFELMSHFLKALTQSPASAGTVFAFELKLLHELGLQPDEKSSRLTPGAKEIVKVLARQDWSALARLKLTSAQEKELRQFLHGFLIFHLGKIPKSRGSAVSLERS